MLQTEEMQVSFPLQGMGGQHNYFGLWVDVDFGKGHSKAKPTCTTYSSPQLSAQEDFRFEKMEVWAVGDPSVTQPVSVGVFVHFLSLVPFLMHLEMLIQGWFPAAVAGQRGATGYPA